MDLFLKTLVTGFLSYIRDTTDCFNKLRQLPLLPHGYLLVTFDVSSLYTNIPHEEGLTTCEEALYQRNTQEPSTADLCHLMQLVLIRNTFTLMVNSSCNNMALPWGPESSHHMLTCSWECWSKSSFRPGT